MYIVWCIWSIVFAIKTSVDCQNGTIAQLCYLSCLLYNNRAILIANALSPLFVVPRQPQYPVPILYSIWSTSVNSLWSSAICNVVHRSLHKHQRSTIQWCAMKHWCADCSGGVHCTLNTVVSRCTKQSHSAVHCSLSVQFNLQWRQSCSAEWIVAWLILRSTM